jgi:peptide/nickel transport system substrate-binding protein
VRCSRALAVLVVLALAACSGGDDDRPDEGAPATTTTTAAVAPGGSLAVGIEGEVDDVDPAQGVLSYSALTVAMAVFDPLLVERSDGEVVPYLASSFEGNDDGTAWTIGLREGVTFSDGAPLDAAAVVAAFDRLLAAPFLRQVLRPLLSVTAADSRTVVLASEPWPELPALLTGQLGLVPAPTMADGRHPIGAGAFTVDELVGGQPVRLARNETYWRTDDDLPALDTLELHAEPDVARRVALLANGALDAIVVSGASALADAEDVAIDEPDGSRRALVALAGAEHACVAAIAAGDDVDCDVTQAVVRTDQPEDALEPLEARWTDAGIDVVFEQVDAAALRADALAGTPDVVVTIDDGLLAVGRLDGEPVAREVIEPIPWSYGRGANVGGVLGALPLPDDDGETRAVPGVLVPAALHRTR